MAASLLSVDTGLEPGDRFEVFLPAEVRATGRLLVAYEVRDLGVSPTVVEDEHGHPLKTSWDPSENSLSAPDWTQSLPNQCAAVWLESLGGDRFRLRPRARLT